MTAINEYVRRASLLSAKIKVLVNKIKFFTAQELSLEVSNSNVITFGNEHAIGSKLISVIGKEHSFECTKELPISSQKEALVAASHMTNIAPFPGKTFFIAEKIGSDKTLIHCFTVKQDIYDKAVQNSLFVVPESLLLFSALKKSKARRIEAEFNRRIIVSSNDVSGFECFLKQANDHTFSFPNLETQIESEKLSAHDYFSFIINQLFALPLDIYQQAINISSLTSKVMALPLKQMALTAIVTFSIYMIGVSSYLSYKDSSLTAQINEQQSSLNELFLKQRDIEKRQAQLRELAENSEFSQLSAPLWSLVIELFKNGAEFSLISFLDNEISLRLKAEKSTEVMQFLSAHPQVFQPTLVSPAVKTRGKELFTVKFTFKEEK